jgi:hypothetical protein
MAKESFLVDFATILARKIFGGSNSHGTGVQHRKRFFFFKLFHLLQRYLALLRLALYPIDYL